MHNGNVIALVLVSLILLVYGACGQVPEAPKKAAGSSAVPTAIEQKKTVRIRHISGEILAVNTQAKTITVKFKDEDVVLRYDDNTVVKVDLESVEPAEIPSGARATVKYIEKKGLYLAKGIFISTETAEKKEGSPQSFFRNSAKHMNALPRS